MKKVDYLIVGGGLAGLSFAFQCQKNNVSFVLIDGQLRSSSKVAGGMYNPIILKRFTAVADAQKQLDVALPMYKELESWLNCTFLHAMPILRKFASIQEQNDWFLACDQPALQAYLNPELHKATVQHMASAYGFGEVYSSGFVDVPFFVQRYQDFLKESDLMRTQVIDYKNIESTELGVRYEDLYAQHLVFAEGFSLNQNPYFSELPLDGTKGELLLVHIPQLKLKKIIKSGVFLIPYGHDLYKVGATYNWSDKTDTTTEEGKKELLEGLTSLIDCPYEIVAHWAGVRPTVKDRRPLIGTHYAHKNVHLLNGLGTRGVLMGPYLAQELFEHLQRNTSLTAGHDIARYYKKMNLK